METRLPQFLHDETFIIALANLSSALHTVHNFTAEVMNLHLAGCHHDLAPRNILVHGQAFLLADFGLSRFKDAAQASDTSFKQTRSFYIAPECQDLEGNLQESRIGRSSDVWSFGCILMNILTYMKYGKAGVEKFQLDRRYETPEFIWYRFHEGPKKESAQVKVWLEKLGVTAQTHEEHLLVLIQNMLAIRPSQRPKSENIIAALQLIAIEATAKRTGNLFLESLKESTDIEASVESSRFQSWQWALGTTAKLFFASKMAEPDSDAIQLNFSETIKSLQAIQANLRESTQISIRPQGRQWPSTRWHTNMLLSMLPKGLQGMARNHWETAMLETQTPEILEATQEALSLPDGVEFIGILAAVKRMTILAEKRALLCKAELRMKVEDIKVYAQIEQHSLASLHQPPPPEGKFLPPEEKFLVEWLSYDARWAVDFVGTELHLRVESIAECLSSRERGKIPHVLRCFGFFHDPMQHAFGLAYHLTPLYFKYACEPISLRRLLSEEFRAYRPLLEDRFKLALDLVSSVLTFHKVGWLHRALNPSNVMFFPSPYKPPIEWARNPYIVGFTHSRQNDKRSLTQGPTVGNDFKEYRHPDYLTNEHRYQPQYDYYSLGMMLLEIGLWDSLSSISGSKSFAGLSGASFRQKVIERRVSQLGQAMGTRYARATEFALRAILGSTIPILLTVNQNCMMLLKVKSLIP